MKTILAFFAVFCCVSVMAQPIPGTQVPAQISPGDFRTTFSIGNTTFMQGTPKSVSDTNAMFAISQDRRLQGMVVWNMAEDAEYRLVDGLDNTNWMITSSRIGKTATTITNFNFYTTNLFITNAYVSNYFTTNVLNNSYVSNYLFTNYIVTNIYFTNLTVTNVLIQDTTVSNFFNTNVFVTDSFVSNYFVTNLYQFTTNLNTYITTVSNVAYLNTNNNWTSTSSNFLGNSVWTWKTNASNTTPDFAVPTSTLSTNASFTWLKPTHLDTTGLAEQWIITHVTNTLGSTITMTAPAGCHVCGAGVNNVTNWTEVLWEYIPPSGPTNYWPIPGY